MECGSPSRLRANRPRNPVRTCLAPTTAGVPPAALESHRGSDVCWAEDRGLSHPLVTGGGTGSGKGWICSGLETSGRDLGSCLARPPPTPAGLIPPPSEGLCVPLGGHPWAAARLGEADASPSWPLSLAARAWSWEGWAPVQDSRWRNTHTDSCNWEPGQEIESWSPPADSGRGAGVTGSLLAATFPGKGCPGPPRRPALQCQEGGRAESLHRPGLRYPLARGLL